MVILSADDSSLFVLNEVGTAIWEAADGQTTLDAIADGVCREFDVDLETALRDVSAFVSALAAAGVLSVAEEADPVNASLMDRVRDRAFADGVPLAVHFDLTYRCNERCVHCYLDHDDHGEMTTVEVRDVLDQLAAAGTLFLTFSGGELLLRRDFFELLAYARQLRFDVKVKTNAMLVGVKEAARIRELGVRQVQVSVYSHRPEVHDAITKVRGSLRRTVKAIRFLTAHGPEGHHRERADAAERVGLRRRACALGTARRRVHDGSDDYAEDGRQQVDPGAGACPRRRCFACSGTARSSATISAGPRRRVRSTTPGARRAALQRRPHRVLHHAVRRRLSLRAVPPGDGQRPPTALHRHLA